MQCNGIVMLRGAVLGVVKQLQGKTMLRLVLA